MDAFTAPFDMSLSPHLLLAALEDDAAVVKDLVSRGAWTECRADSGATPLICAAAKESIASRRRRFSRREPTSWRPTTWAPTR